MDKQDEKRRLKIPRLDVMRSGLMTALTLSSVIIVLGLGCKQKGKGTLHRLTSSDDRVAVTPKPPKFGNQEATVLKRLQTFNGTVPEFTELIVLPGRGMDILGIKAYIPGKGEVSILASPDIAEAAKIMTGTGADAHGEANMTVGGAFLFPFTNPLSGAVSPDGKTISLNVHGHPVTLPAMPGVDGGGSQPMARYGLLSLLAASQTQLNTMPDGVEMKGTFDPSVPSTRWPGKLQFAVSALLSGRAIDLTFTARNDGPDPVPVGIGWYPRFAIPSGDREHATLRLPMAMQLAESDKTHLLTPRLAGQIVAENGFNARGGQALGDRPIQATFVHMKPALFDNGPTVELRDPASDYGLKIVAMSSAINGLRVIAPADKPWLVVSPRANMTDPTGAPLDTEKPDSLMLQPGKTLQWRVRLELFAPSMQTKPIGM